MAPRPYFLGLAAGLLACSGSPDQPIADTGVDAGQDAGPVPCSESIVGKRCTATGGECGAGHTCLLVDATAGFCSCACNPEDPMIPEIEDSCPGTELVCAPHGTNGNRCFRYLGNARPGCVERYTHNWDTEYSFAYANMELARLTPASAFTVLAVRYTLGGTGTGSVPCNSTVPHRVDLWVDAATTPAASPTLATSTQAGPAPAAKTVVVAPGIEPALRLQSGQHLFVAVELSDKVSGSAMCIATCGTGATGDRSYTSWTAASTANNVPPYTWSSYSAMGAAQELVILALGFEG